jgi:hypothetical protein
MSNVFSKYAAMERAVKKRFSVRFDLKAPNLHLLLAIVLAFVYHGVLLLSYNFEKTYEALLHVFFADHYYRYWWSPWDYRWYTGFTMTSYPPGAEQSIALVAHLFRGSLLNAFIAVQLAAILTITLGMYRFASVWVSEEAAGYAALLVVFCSSMTETVHVFGQLPTTLALGFLLNAVPYAYSWLDRGRKRDLCGALAFSAATTAAQQITALFGAVFFVLPVVALVMVQKFRQPLADESTQRRVRVSRKNVRALFVRRLRRVLPVSARAVIYGTGLVVALIIVVLPYWMYSRSDPITQVPIPSASRDNFLVDTSASLVFWLIPYGLSILTFPYAFYKGYSTKGVPLALSYSLLVLLSTGGTTPLPHMILGNAFNLLTLDRFALWATFIQLPWLGEFVVSMRKGKLAKLLQGQMGFVTWWAIQVVLLLSYLALSINVANFVQFRRFQPTPIAFQPIITFLNKDQHARWRYITLGFGDQMSLLSSATLATSVDGDYNAPRQLPELNISFVGRLEGAKYAGIPDIGSLQQVLAIPEKYNLKYIFSNDSFYDPLLFFSGWHRLQRLEDGIIVWERADIPPLPDVLPQKNISVVHSVMWGTIPMAAIFAALIVLSAQVWLPLVHSLLRFVGVPWLLDKIRYRWRHIRWPRSAAIRFLWYIPGNIYVGVYELLVRWSQVPPGDEVEEQEEKPWQFRSAWIAKLRQSKPASPNIQLLRASVLCLLLISSLAYAINAYLQQKNDPITIVQSYYDDLDFRRYSNAYDRLDPLTRPTLDLYLLRIYSANGLVSSYGKLESVSVHIIKKQGDHLQARADAVWITALILRPTTYYLTMVKRTGTWYIEPQFAASVAPPDEFLRRPIMAWHGQGRAVVTTGTTSFGDVEDRPILQILSARLVQVGKIYSVVGELINTDVNPADVTVTAVLLDKYRNGLSTYNAQAGMLHTLLPKETTPFRVDFEGVAETGLVDARILMGAFKPGLVTPLRLHARIDSFQVFAKAVVTEYNLDRGVEVHDIRVQYEADGKPHLVGTLFNSSTLEATVPHLLVTYYDAHNQVLWVDSSYLEQAVEPERDEDFDVVITPLRAVKTILTQGDIYTNMLDPRQELQASQLPWLERYPTSAQTGYSSLRISINYLIGVV